MRGTMNKFMRSLAICLLFPIPRCCWVIELFVAGISDVDLGDDEALDPGAVRGELDSGGLGWLTSADPELALPPLLLLVELQGLGTLGREVVGSGAQIFQEFDDGSDRDIAPS